MGVAFSGAFIFYFHFLFVFELFSSEWRSRKARFGFGLALEGYKRGFGGLRDGRREDGWSASKVGRK